MNANEMEYVGFFPRAWAALIDGFLLAAVTWPLLTIIYGWEYWLSNALILGWPDLFITWIFPALAAVAFWRIKQATPGKMAVSARVVDSRTGRPASVGKLLIRYIGYFVSIIPLGLGIIWVAFDSRRQGWHDKIAGTVVIRMKNYGPVSVDFVDR